MTALTWYEAFQSGPGPNSQRDYILLYFKAFAMGIADLIPGISGGTIAFITRIYEPLLAAISSIKKDVFKDIVTFNFKSAFSKIHMRFLITMAFGIATSAFSLAHLMHYLINEYPVPTWSLFFGLIGASIIVLCHQLQLRNPCVLGFMAIGTLSAYFIVGLVPLETPNNLWFIYLCGAIAITAMILPGISGSFLLLILGKYEHIIGAVKSPFTGSNIGILIVFMAGMITGLLCFSKILHFLIKSYRELTMAFLTGILIGSLTKIWPWKIVVESKMIRGKMRIIQEENIWPNSIDSTLLIALSLMILSFISVLYIEKLFQLQKANHNSHSAK